MRLPLAETRSRRGRWPGCLPTVALLPRIMWEGKGWGTDGSPTFQPCGRPSSSSSKAASLQLQVDRRRNATVLMTQGEAEKAAATTRAAARSGRGGDARGRLGRLEARAERIKRVFFLSPPACSPARERKMNWAHDNSGLGAPNLSPSPPCSWPVPVPYQSPLFASLGLQFPTFSSYISHHHSLCGEECLNPNAGVDS